MEMSVTELKYVSMENARQVNLLVVLTTVNSVTVARVAIPRTDVNPEAIHVLQIKPVMK